MLFVLIFLNACGLKYVAKQGVYQAELLAGREKITKVLQEDGHTANTYQKLALILDIREFAKRKLKLKLKNNYSTINLNWNRVIHNVSASKKLAFEPYYWWFPIIGFVPYKGFFDKESANTQAQDLRSENYDVLQRIAAGYSTVGFFEDPVWPSMLKYSEYDLAELIIHELAHGTLYFDENTQLNENYANFVGRVGALAYIKQKYGVDSPKIKKILNYYQDQAKSNKWMADLYDKLNDLYHSKLKTRDKLKHKGKIIQKALKLYRKIDFINSHFKQRNFKNLNNARILSFKRYYSDLDKLSKLFIESGYDWVKWRKALKDN